MTDFSKNDTIKLMITKEDIKNLASLSRIELAEEEADKMTSEIDSILGYVGQITQTTSDLEMVIPNHKNILRDDVVTNAEGEYTEKILKNAPDRDGDHLRVKKIL